MKSYSRLSKPPVGRSTKGNKKQRPNMQNYNDFETIIGMYNTEVDPKSTVGSVSTKNKFWLPKRFPRNVIRAISNDKKPSLKAYKSIDIRRPTFNNKRKKNSVMRPMTAKFNGPKAIKSFLRNADTLKEIKHQIMDDNNYTIS